METKVRKNLIHYLCDYFGEALVSVVFFGSRARGEAKAASDYDIFLVAKNLPKRPFERHRFVRKAVAFKFDQKISIYAKTKKEFEGGFPPLYLDLGVDGQILYDIERYMQQRLHRVREIIKSAGLYRIKRNGYYLWQWENQPGRQWSITWEGFYDGTG